MDPAHPELLLDIPSSGRIIIENTFIVRPREELDKAVNIAPRFIGAINAVSTLFQ